MTAAWILVAVLAGLTESGSIPVEAPVPAASPGELRSAYSQALQTSARRQQPDPFAVVPTLVDLYRQLDDDRSLSHAERSRMRRGVKTRLEELRDRVLRDALAREQQRRRDAHRAARAGRAPAETLSGGGEAARAVELIELIQNTIAPESWDVNGGNGTIRYFGLLKVLVVRQTGEVHHQIGNGLSQLKK